jgi:hypothetical protein
MCQGSAPDQGQRPAVVRLRSDPADSAPERLPNVGPGSNAARVLAAAQGVTEFACAILAFRTTVKAQT